MAKVTCPNPDCRTVSPIPDALVGRKVRCKVCNTIFVTAVAEAPAAAGASVTRADGDDGLTMTGRRAATLNRSRGGPAAGRSAPAKSGGRGVWLVVAAVLLLPVVVAGGFCAFKMLGPHDQAAAPGASKPSPSGEASGGAGSGPPNAKLYGGIEIGSSGVKAAVFELFPDKALGYDYKFVWKKSIDTKLVNGLEKAGRFDPDALHDTVDAVQQFFDKLATDYQVPKDRIFIAGSSGLFKKVRDNKDFDDDAKEGLIQKDQTALADPVLKTTGRKMTFISVSQEVQLLIGGLVPKKYDGSSVLIDVGTGATRGGCHDLSGLFVSFEAPGVGALEAKIKKQADKPEAMPQVAGQLVGAEFLDPLRKALARKTGLVNRQRVYLNGGIVWVMATLRRPKERGFNVPLTADDIHAFRKQVGLHPQKKFPDVVLPDDLDATVRADVEAEVADMRNRFETSKLIAGGELLEALSAELQFEDKELYFPRYGDYGWLLSYIGESYSGEKGLAGK